VLGLILALAVIPAVAEAQVAREEVTLGRLAEGADLVVIGQIGPKETLGEGRHEATLAPVTAEGVVKGPETPGQILVFQYVMMRPTAHLESGETALLFLKALTKEDLRCTGCGKTWREVHDLADGNYYWVLGASWGKVAPAHEAAEMLQETLRLQGQGNAASLKGHLLQGMQHDDPRLATDCVLDLLRDEKALSTLNASDAAAIVSHIQMGADRFRPLEALVALAGYTASPEAAPSLVQLLYREDPPDARILATALGRLREAGVEVVASLQAELGSTASVEVKGRLIRTAALLGDQGITDTILPFTEDGDLRKKALLALGDLKDPRGLPVLLAGLEEEEEIRRTSAVALAFYLGDGLKALVDWQENHPDDELARFIDELRRNPVKVRRSLGEW
jgi:hypothetical protein